MRARWLVWFGIAGCQPAPAPPVEDAPCPAPRPEQGGLQSFRLTCSADQPDSEARTRDVLLGNALSRAVIRDGPSALGYAGVGGGSLISLAPWGAQDLILEVLPLSGGWALGPSALTLRDGAVSFEAGSAPLPWQSAPPQQLAQISWYYLPDDPRLWVDGAQSLLIRPNANVRRASGALLTDRMGIAFSGELSEDGSVIVLNSQPGFLVAGSPARLPNLAWGVTEQVEIVPEATYVRFSDGQNDLARVQADTEHRAFLWPGATRWRAEAVGSAPGPWWDSAEPAPLGAAGRVQVRLAFNGLKPRMVGVNWTDANGEDRLALVPPEGLTLLGGAGTIPLSLAESPRYEPRALSVNVADNTTTLVHIGVTALTDPPDHVLWAPAWPGGRDLGLDGDDIKALRNAVGAGLDAVSITPHNDVADPTDVIAEAPRLRIEGGVTLSHPLGDLRVAPVSPSARSGGHGALRVWDLSAEDALGAAQGGPTTGQKVHISQELLAALPALSELNVKPSAVRLTAPGAAGPEAGPWAPWFDRLDRGDRLSPSGPYVWVRVDDAQVWSEAELYSSASRGSLVAGTGAMIALDLAGLGPGDTLSLSPEQAPPSARATLSAGGDADWLVLIANGQELARSRVRRGQATLTAALPSDASWLLAATYSEQGEDWSATGPIFIAAPGLDTGP